MYRVLVVDDEKIEREGIKFLLSREEGEFEISEASNGRQALEILRNEEIDLLLTDIKMPHMDGLELAKKAKEEKEELQIVIFSGYNDFSFAQEAIRYGVKEYVLKPVDPDIFSETLEKVRSEIDKKKPQDQRSEGTGFSPAVFSPELYLHRKKRNSGKSRRNAQPGYLESVALCHSGGILPEFF